MRAMKVCAVINCPALTRGSYCNRHAAMTSQERNEDEREIKRREKPFWELHNRAASLKREGGNPSEIARLEGEAEQARLHLAELFGENP